MFTVCVVWGHGVTREQGVGDCDDQPRDYLYYSSPHSIDFAEVDARNLQRGLT